MSRRTIRIVDLLCDVANWNDSIANSFPEERASWTKERDRKLAMIRATMAALTKDELDLIRRRYEPHRLARQLREIGVAPRW